MRLSIDVNSPRYRGLETFEDNTVEFISLFKGYLNKSDISSKYFLEDSEKFGIYYFILVKDKNSREYIIPIKYNSDLKDLDDFEFGDSLFLNI